MLRASLTTAALLVAAALGTATAAHASTPGGSAHLAFGATSATALTWVTNDPDGGHGTPATWADDDFWRIVTVTRSAQVPGTDCGLSPRRWAAGPTPHPWATRAASPPSPERGRRTRRARAARGSTSPGRSQGRSRARTRSRSTPPHPRRVLPSSPGRTMTTAWRPPLRSPRPRGASSSSRPGPRSGTWTGARTSGRTRSRSRISSGWTRPPSPTTTGTRRATGTSPASPSAHAKRRPAAPGPKTRNGGASPVEPAASLQAGDLRHGRVQECPR